MIGFPAIAARLFGCVLLVSSLLVASATRVEAQTADTVDGARQAMRAPPEDARILMRWWWFGAAVVPEELDREMQQMKAGGIGGFEIQPVYAQALDDPETGFKNLPYLSAPFLDAVRFTNDRAHQLGLRVDMTLASGWPYGGPHTPVTQASAKLRVVQTTVSPESNSVALPALSNGEALVAAYVLNDAAAAPSYEDLLHAQQLPLPAAGDLRIVVPGAMPSSSAPHQIWFFISSRTGQMVKRAAVGADGFVLDHFDRTAVEAHLKDVGEPLMTAFGDKPPYSVFSDSLEVYDADWTPNFMTEFKRRRGYDLAPYLPLLFAGNGDQARSLRHDWGETLTELVNESYLAPITAWAHRHHTRFRSQTYGDPAVDLSSNALVDLPEGEGPQWRSFSYTRWASSANHLYKKNVTSAETWTWLHSPAFRATPLDMKAEADLFFLQGVNQLVGHGWPYTPPGIAEPGWAFYAAAVFNDSNPWWIVMPDVTGYLQRVSALLRQGEPANDVAIYVPTDDAWADFVPGHVALTDYAKRYITPELTASILNAGYNFDYIDAAAIDSGKLHYPILVLPNVDRISPAIYRQIADYAAHGGKVIAIGRTPQHSTGLIHWQQDSTEIAAISTKFFAPSSSSIEVKDETAIDGALHQALAPDVQFSPTVPELGFIHRKLADGDIYFIVNTGNRPVATKANFRAQRSTTEVWDMVHQSMRSVPANSLDLTLEPYESIVVLLRDSEREVQSKPANQKISVTLNLGDSETNPSASWIANFERTGATTKVHLPYLWDSEPATQYYSGVVAYARDFEMPDLKKASTWWIDFGAGTPIDPPSIKHNGTLALLDSPVREAAVVYVNGKRAGSVWCPPYRVNVTGLLHPGSNHLQIRVANTSINTLAGRSLPDYRLLNQLYGARFQPQAMDHLAPLPSGIAGQVKLIGESEEPRP